MDYPPAVLLGLEGIRALYEYGVGCLCTEEMRHNSPKGDGHPVVVLPGLGGADGSTKFIRSFLEDLGYRVYGWGLGRNVGPRHGVEQLLSNIYDKLVEVSSLSGDSPVSVIGWSLGGVYAREVAKLHPEIFRQVITLGTPFKTGSSSGSTAAPVNFMYEKLSKDYSYRDPDTLRKISEPPPVPFTSIYSKTDGIVHWTCSIETPGHFIENVEVLNVSHMGLGVNPLSLSVVADRLTHTKETWVPYSA